MARLKWDQIGERSYETGIDHGVLYVMENGEYPKGVVWNGLTTVTESPSGAEANDIYADNMKYLTLRSAETFGLTIECLTYPDEWSACNGETSVAPGVKIHQQSRKMFGVSYRSIKGNDTEGNDHGYKLHLAYGCSASPSEEAYSTVNDSPDPITMSYEISTTPIPVEGHKATSLFTIDSTLADPEKLKALEDILYGSDEGDAEPRLPLPDEIIAMFAAG